MFDADDVGSVKIAQDKVARMTTDKANTVQYKDMSTEEAVVNMSNGVYTADGGQVDVVRDAYGNVVSTNVYVRILIMQPGYENGVVLERWTGVDEVTILPRPLEITLDN